MSEENSDDILVKISKDGGQTWDSYVIAKAEPTETPTPSPSETATPTPTDDNNGGTLKAVFEATYLSHVNDGLQNAAYKPYLKETDYVRLWQEKDNLTSVNYDDLFKSQTLRSAFDIDGIHGAVFKTSKQAVALAATLKQKNAGFSFIELNIENTSEFVRSEYQDFVNSFKKAADAAHKAGLKFYANITRADANTYAVELSKFTDRLHVRTDDKQDLGPAAFRQVLTDMIGKVKEGNPDSKMKYSCQVNTAKPAMAGKSLMDTFKLCTDAVLIGRNEAEGLDWSDDLECVTCWFVNETSQIQLMRDYTKWFKTAHPS